MTEPATGLPHQIEERLLYELRTQDPEVKIRIRRASLGWLYLHIIGTVFAEQDLLEREERIDAILAVLNLELSRYPFLDWRLQTPEEAEEAQEDPFPLIEIPLWSEILTAPEPENPIPIDQTTTKRPLVVTFYSFTGNRARGTSAYLSVDRRLLTCPRGSYLVCTRYTGYRKNYAIPPLGGETTGCRPISFLAVTTSPDKGC